MDQDMLNENLNNMSWKNKLEDVDSLSSATLTNKNATWEKLHARLHQQPRRTRAVWYWAAAACLLTAVIVPLITTNKKQPEIVTNNTVPVSTNKATAQQQLPVNENVPTVVPADNNNKTVTIQTDQPINYKKINSGIAPVKSTIDPGVFIEQEDIPATTTISITPVQIPVTETTTTVVVSEKKKLKVVHINELGDPVSEPRTRLHPDDYGVIQFKLIDQQVYTSSPAPSSSTGFNILKSKNVPSN
jgi:hypothetical protein